MYFLYQMRSVIEPYSSGLYVNILGDDIDTKYIEQGGAESCFNTGSGFRLKVSISNIILFLTSDEYIAMV